MTALAPWAHLATVTLQLQAAATSRHGALLHQRVAAVQTDDVVVGPEAYNAGRGQEARQGKQSKAGLRLSQA